MYIAMVSAECAPLAKAGGLGDFIQGLSRDLVKRGERLEVFLPKYDVLQLDAVRNLREVETMLHVPYQGATLECRVSQCELRGVSFVLIDPQSEQAFFNRGRIYGESDDAERFAFFCRAVLEFLLQSGRHPEILHCNDWQTGLIPVLLQELYADSPLAETRVCYTLHNVGYQGVVGESVLRQVGLDSRALLVEERLQHFADPGAANLMKGGIIYSDFVTTVSPRYAWEIQNTDQGMGLQDLFRTHAAKLGGVLNGLDMSVWNPRVDPLIPAHFGKTSLPRKAANRRALRERMGLREIEKPIIAVVSRLDYQKGVDLIEHGVRYSLIQGAQVVLLGSAIDPEIDARFTRLRDEFADSGDCRLELSYDEALAHLIYAGSDMILIPSVWEPCGLTQLIAMQYGVVPIARRVGGLADTVVDANYSDKPFSERNGYLFDDLTESGIESAIYRAMDLWLRFPEYFRELRINGMRVDSSWKQSGQQYLELYRELSGELAATD